MICAARRVHADTHGVHARTTCPSCRPGAAGVEAPAMAGEQVCIVGGANSAGQAALHLAKVRRRVTLLARGESLAASMSDYLIT